MTGEFILRLGIAGILGAAIGLEREWRAKEAGLRTHFLVALGSALIMIVSQWGFQGSAGVEGTRPADAARVAAQIVSGIGFLGAGTIIVHRQFVRGLTTAAGLWVAAGIGMAVGGGLYLLACAATVFVLIGLEVLQFLWDIKTKFLSLSFLTVNRDNLVNVTNILNDHGYKITQCTVTNETLDNINYMRVVMKIRSHQSADESRLIQYIQQFPDIKIEHLE
jgi:putative Mg2+ transporter-C (MgtC) family protein